MFSAGKASEMNELSGSMAGSRGMDSSLHDKYIEPRLLVGRRTLSSFA
jgi:hypothetical protein